MKLEFGHKFLDNIWGKHYLSYKVLEDSSGSS